MKLLTVTLFTSVFASGCATTFIEKEKSWNPKGTMEAVVVHYSVVDRAAEGSKSLLDVVVDVANHFQGKQSQLGVAGKKAFATVKPVFYQYDMKLGFDLESSKKVKELKGVLKAKRETGSGGLIGKGDWVHPETVDEAFHLPGTFFREKFYKAVSKTVLKGDKNKVAVSMGMTFEKEKSWFVGWECIATFRSRALDHTGKPVFLVSSKGASSWFFGGGDRYLTEACPEAAAAAVENLGQVEPGTL